MFRKLVSVPLFCLSLLAQNQPPVAIKPASLFTDGVPVIHASARTKGKLDLYATNQAASLLGWSRAGGMLVRMASSKSDFAQISELTSPMAKPREITNFDAEVASASWNPVKAGSIVVQKDNNGDEIQQIYRMDLEQNSLTRLSDGRSINGYPIWNPKGDRMAFCSTDNEKHTNSLWVVDPQNPSSRKEITQLPGGSAYNFVHDWSPDGRHLLVMSGDILANNRILMVDVATGEKEDITPSKDAVFIPIGFTADSHGILLLANVDSEFKRLAYFDLDRMSMSFLTPDTREVDAYYPGDFGWPALSPDRKWLAFCLKKDGLSTLHLLDVEKRRIRNIHSPAFGLVQNIHWNGDNKEFAFNIVSNQSAGDIYSVNIDTNKTKRWTKLGQDALDLTKNVNPELIKWNTFDHRKISGWLYRPPTQFKGKRPVMIEIHGGPTDEYLPGALGTYNYYVNDLGIALIFPNIRGSMGYGKTFMDLDNGYKREGAFKDIEALLDWIKQDPSLDASRIMIGGGSYGGYMALTMATRVSDRVACFVSSSGMSDLVSEISEQDPARAGYFTKEFGDPKDPKMKSFLERISPINNVSKIKKPIMIIAGTNDPRVMVTQASTMVTALKAQGGVPVWYLNP